MPVPTNLTCTDQSTSCSGRPASLQTPSLKDTRHEKSRRRKKNGGRSEEHRSVQCAIFTLTETQLQRLFLHVHTPPTRECVCTRDVDDHRSKHPNDTRTHVHTTYIHTVHIISVRPLSHTHHTHHHTITNQERQTNRTTTNYLSNTTMKICSIYMVHK